MTARFLVGDVFDRMAEIPDSSVDLVVTSPPFLALRSYLPADHPEKGKEIGSEPTPAAFLDTLLDLTAEWRRVLAPHGSICVELGDTYSGSGGAGGDYNKGGLRDGQERFDGSASRAYGTGAAARPSRTKANRGATVTNRGRDYAHNPANYSTNGKRDGWPLTESLTGIPSLYAFSLAYGRNLLNPVHEIEPWRVRNLIAWTRPNPPVGALGDKVRPGTSYVTTACVGTKRYFDQDAERTPYGERSLKNDGYPTSYHSDTAGGYDERERTVRPNPAGTPLLDHWSIPTQPYKGSHYATFPDELPRRLINLMCPPRVCNECGKPSERITERSEDYAAARAAIGDFNNRGRDGNGVSGSRSVLSKEAGRNITSAENTTVGWTDCEHNDWRRGLVLDPFAGSGTTLAVALGMGRDSIGIDLDARNADLAYQRVGMFLEIEHPTGDDFDYAAHGGECTCRECRPTVPVHTGDYL